MPRQPTDARYAERVAVLAEMGMRPAKITDRIKTEATAEGRNDYPAKRTVERIYQRHLGRPAAERRAYALFRWPDSMMNGTLPWEASRAALELLYRRNEKGQGRPTIRLVNWYWRLSMVAFSLDADVREYLAGQLAAWEIDRSGTGFTPRNDVDIDVIEAIEWLLAYRPWEDDERGVQYLSDSKRTGVLSLFRKQDLSPSAEQEHLRWLWGTTDEHEGKIRILQESLEREEQANG
jgi:hypothetical protein